MSIENGFNLLNAQRRGLVARVPPLAAVLLVAVSGVFWYATTQPFHSLRAITRSPAATLDAERWALLYSSVYGSVVLVAGLVAIAIYVAEMRRCSVQAGVDARARVPMRSDAGSSFLIQRLQADIASCEARFRSARHSGDPREIARAAASGRRTMDDILSELHTAGVDPDERVAD